jgi:hypothetical protein
MSEWLKEHARLRELRALIARWHALCEIRELCHKWKVETPIEAENAPWSVRADRNDWLFPHLEPRARLHEVINQTWVGCGSTITAEIPRFVAEILQKRRGLLNSENYRYKLLRIRRDEYPTAEDGTIQKRTVEEFTVERGYDSEMVTFPTSKEELLEALDLDGARILEQAQRMAPKLVERTL